MNLRRMLSKAGNFLRPSRAESDLDREISAHLTLLEDEYKRRGMDKRDAHMAAAIAYGGVEQAKEMHREERSFAWLERTWANLRYGLRTLRRAPGFTFIAILTIALGIGANTAIFSVVNTVLLHPLPYRDADRLVALTSKDIGAGVTVVSYVKYESLRDEARTLEGVGAFYALLGNLSIGTTPDQIPACHVSQNFFDLLGVAPALGRNFLPAEDREGGADVGIVTDAFWRARLNGSLDAVGKSISLDGKSVTIVGVLPASFRFPFNNPLPDVWMPRPFENREYTRERIRLGASYLLLIGKLKQPLAAAQGEVDVINRHYAESHPGIVDAGKGLAVQPLQTFLVGSLGSALVALLAAVGFVLLICCVNVASLLLARGTTREKEIAVRRALGATQGHLVSQLLAESVALALIGGGIGITAAWVGLPLLMRVVPDGAIPFARDIGVDGPVLGFSLLLCLLTGVAFGLAPALHASRSSVRDGLSESGRGSTSGRRGGRARQWMVISEVALALLLMTGAGLLIKSFVMLMRVNPGFESAHVMTFPFALSPPRYATPGQRVEFFRQFRERAGGLPGVQAAGLISHLPLGGGYRLVYTCPETIVCQGLGKDPISFWEQVSPGFFDAMHVPLRAGRDFEERDTVDGPRVAIVNETIAKKYFPNGDALGRHIANSRDMVPMEIVGVAADVKMNGLNSPSQEGFYVPAAQGGWSSMTLVVRSAGKPEATIAAVRQAARELDPELALAGITSMDEVLGTSVAQPRFVAQLVGAFAALALLLSAIGIYGVMAFLVTQRSQEMAIRMALGAPRSSVFGLVVSRGLKLVTFGIAIGLLLSFAMTRLLDKLLFRTTALDLLTFTAVSLTFVAVGLAACYVPAWRATRLDTLSVLRSQ